jgi:ArsR family transcriptional regulator
MDEITILQAEVLKVLASPRRLEILHVLAEGPIEVGRLATTLGVSQPNVSQHLSVMRSAGMVEAERDGREVRYRLADAGVIQACQIMRGVLERRLSRLGRLASTDLAATDASAIAAATATATATAATTTPAIDAAAGTTELAATETGTHTLVNAR